MPSACISPKGILANSLNRINKEEASGLWQQSGGEGSPSTQTIEFRLKKQPFTNSKALKEVLTRKDQRNALDMLSNP